MGEGSELISHGPYHSTHRQVMGSATQCSLAKSDIFKARTNEQVDKSIAVDITGVRNRYAELIPGMLTVVGCCLLHCKDTAAQQQQE